MAVDYPFDVYEETTVHIGTRWGASDGSHSSVNLNFYVPRSFLRRLTTEYSDRFTGSVGSCLDLLARPLFGRENGERLELSTHLGGMIPLKYWLIRENNLPPQDVIDSLGREFEQFTRTFAAGPMLPTGQWRGRYFCKADVKYRRSSKKVDAQLELRLRVPATATKERFEAFRSKALTSITFQQEAGRSYIRSVEEESSIDYGFFALAGDLYGNVSIPEVIEETRRLFEDADIGLPFPD